MRYTSILTTALLLASTLPAATADAQQTGGAPAPAVKTVERTAEQAELQRKALGLLDEVIGEMSSLKLLENRIRLQAAVAEILWPHNQERAREIFNAAANDLSAVTANAETDEAQYYNLMSTTSQLRQRMLTTIGERDPKLALEFLRATRQPPPPQQPGANVRQPDPELLLETQLAQQIAMRDPQQAMRIAEEVLSRGLTSNLIPLLDQLRTRDPEGASRLAANVARKLRTANFAVDFEATAIASHLLLTTRAAESAPTANGQPQPPQTAAAVVAAAQNNARRLQLDEAARRDLVNLLVNAATGTRGDTRRWGNAGALLSTMRQLMPEVERYAPAQAAGLRRQVEGYERVLESGPREQRQLMETGTPDAILEAAAKAAPEMRQQLYRTAAWKAFNEGNPERARQIIGSNIESARQREQMLKEFDQQMFWRAVSEGKVEQAQALLARAKSTDERIGMLLQLARVTSGKGNASVAAGFLDEAWNLSSGRAKSHQQFSIQLQMAHTYALLASPRAFEIMEASVTHLNELVAAAAVLDGFGQNAFAQDELKAQEGYLWSALLMQCSQTLGTLARADFDEALAAADKFQRPELRLTARLAVARGILAAETDRDNFNLNRPISGRGMRGVRLRNED
ncbi:MAG TPA: hypothetical protein VGB61_08380 [Pyrinomonadaceae bacterium]|jgi:hypothetical protein